MIQPRVYIIRDYQIIKSILGKKKESSILIIMVVGYI